MRSKKRTIGILIFIVLISIISGVLIISQKNKEESIYSEDVYSYVDDIIKDTVSSDSYLNADINEKYKIINKTLNSLEKENKILSNSIEYDSENKIFWYNYSDGTEGGIMLENFAEGYSGNANIDNYVVRKDEQGKILSYNCDIDFNSNEYPYTAKEVESLDLKAKFMYGLGFDSILDEYKKYQTIWIKQYLKTDIDDYCTVEDFKSGLSGYNIVFIEEHGCYSNKKIMICTEELTSKKSDSNYKVDLKDKRIKKVINAEDNKQYYWINPSFFSFYYKDNELSNTVIWIGSCHGYQCDDLVNVFSRCGAKAVIGYDESVLTGYDCVMLNPFVYSLLYGDSVSEALNFAKSIFGQNDLEYWRTYRGTTSKFGTIALMPSGKNNCATAKLYPENENARLIDAEIIGAQRGGEIKSKTQSTEPVEITEIQTEPETTTVDISYEGEYGNLRYLVKDGEVIITGCFMQDMTNVEIPSEIDGFPVTTIGNGAFYGENLVSISFPNSITKIKAGAFDYTPWLSKKREENPIVIENNILISWDKTKNETDVIIPDGVISIAGRVFKDYDMVSVTIPNSVVYIGDEAFSECYYLSNVIMSDNITEIGDKAFNSCTKLTSITIPNGTKSIGDYAFAGCEKLVDVTIADSIMSAGCYVFGGQFGETTPWLEEKRKENPIVVVGSVVIDGITCNGDVIIPDNVTEIAEEAFWGSELNSITFPDSIVKIGDSAFGNCKNLSSVVIPKNTEEIGESFSFCESLKEIIFLNPKCKIPISRFTIYNQTESEGNYYTEWYYNGVIKGYKNSTAQEYAELYGYEFIEIEN